MLSTGDEIVVILETDDIAEISEKKENDSYGRNADEIVPCWGELWITNLSNESSDGCHTLRKEISGTSGADLICGCCPKSAKVSAKAMQRDERRRTLLSM